MHLHEFECFWGFSLSMVSNFSPLWSQKMLPTVSIFLNLLGLVLCPIVWSIFENVPCAFEKNIHFASLGWKVLYILVKSIWSRTLFDATISLMGFFFFFWRFINFLHWGIKILLYKNADVCIFLEVVKDSPYIFGCSYVGCIYGYNVYVFLMDS